MIITYIKVWTILIFFSDINKIWTDGRRCGLERWSFEKLSLSFVYLDVNFDVFMKQ